MKIIGKTIGKTTGIRRSLVAAVAVTGLFAVFAPQPSSADNLTLHPAGFGPDSDDSAEVANFNLDWANGELTGVGCYNNEIQLPHGSLIRKLWVYFRSGVPDDFRFEISKVKIKNGAGSTVLRRTIANSDGARVKAKYILGERINTEKFMYMFGVCMGTHEAFYGARIQYAPPG